MRRPVLIAGLVLTAALVARAGSPGEETLRYTINWPSGLGLGEAEITARPAGHGWEYLFRLQAAVPGYAVADRYVSLATAERCSVEFAKDAAHGGRKAREKTAFDYRKGAATRTTENGGKTEIPISACARDALAFLFHLRHELAQGRVPPEQMVLFGSPYRIRLEYGGAETVLVNEIRKQADRITVFCKGPASDLVFEIFFSQDAARTPLVARVPFPMGTFSMELAP